MTAPARMLSVALDLHQRVVAPSVIRLMVDVDGSADLFSVSCFPREAIRCSKGSTPDVRSSPSNGDPLELSLHEASLALGGARLGGVHSAAAVRSR